MSEARTMADIATLVAWRHQVTLADLRGPRRHQKVVLARKDAMTEIRNTGRYSTTQIGRYFNRDHTTVVSATGTLGRRSREG